MNNTSLNKTHEQRIREIRRRRRKRLRRRKRNRIIRRRRIICALGALLAVLLMVMIGGFVARYQTAAKQEVESNTTCRLSAGINADIAEMLNESSKEINRANTTATPALEPARTTSPKTEEERGEAIWTGWAYFESGDECWEQVGGDGGNAYGRFQLDARHSLAAFLRYAAETNPDFVGLERYYRKNGSKTSLKSTEGLAEDWAWICAVYDKEFYQVQAEFAYGTFYCLMRDELLEKRGINLNEYGPVLKGTVWSVAVRNGNNLSSLWSVTDTYYPGIGEEEWLREIYAVEAWRHPDQAKRWEKDQLKSALETLEMLDGGAEVKFYGTFESDARQDRQRIELLELAGDYRDFVRYTGRNFE